MRIFRLRSAFYAVCLLAAAGMVTHLELPVAFAQVTTAAIHGQVTDPSGAVVPGAKITALNTATGIETQTTSDKSGYFILPDLQVGGPYTVTVSAAGFQSFKTSGLTLTVNANREIQAVLKVGAAAQTVEVSATALQVETSNTQLEQIVTAQQLEEVPLEGRDPAGLQKLEPGVVESSDRFGNYSSNGNQTAQNSYMVSGIDINDPALENEGIQVNPDALAEENIVTSTMNPEFARNSGAVVNQVLKSGTNSFHGSGFEFYRDTFLNNGNYFSTTRPIFHQNLYGGTLGGPVFKNRLFFFLAYQGLRNRTATTTVQTTMTSAQLSGDFTSDTNYASQAPDSAGLSTNPIPFSFGNCTAGETWAACFPNGTVNIPPSEWNSIASNLIKTYVPPANYGGGTQYNFNALNTLAQDQGIIRIDYTISPQDSIWASSIFQSSPATEALAFGGGSFPGFGEIDTNHFKLFSAAWTHSFNPNTLNELRAAYYRNPYQAVSPAQVVAPSSLGFNISPQDPESGVPYISVGQYFNLGFSFEGPQPRLDTNLTYADNFTWVKGNHSFKFGGLFEQFRVHNPFDVYNNGAYTFAGGTDGGGIYSSGDPMIDFVMGIPDLYNQTNNGFINAVANEYFAYAQDNWKATPDLTLNYGIAWDVEAPNTNHQDSGLGIICWTNSSTTSNVFAGGPPGLQWPGDPGCNNAGSPTPHYDRFGPRAGFAWSPSNGPRFLFGGQGSHNFSLRGGFGVFYNRDQEEQSLQNLEDPPFVYVSQGATNIGGSPAFANPFADVAGNGSEANPFPYAPVTPQSTIAWDNYLTLQLAAFDHNYLVPYTYNFNLNIQRALPGSMILQAGYVGSLSHRLATWYEGDNITPAGHAACLADTTGCATSLSAIHLLYPQYTAQPAVAPNNPDSLPNGTPYYLSVAEQNTEGASNYNALQVSLIKAPTHGLAFTLGYTYSHALDNGSGYESQTGGDSTYGNAGHVYNYVPGFQYLNYGDSDFDARQRLVASYVYHVPVAGFLKSNLIAREALSGWGIAGITAVQDGFPISVTMGADRSGWCDGYSYFGCPDVPETSSFHIARYNPRSSATHQYFDTSSFSPEPLGTFGNTRRNFFHGPGFNYTNMQLSKDFHFTSDTTRYVQLRLEAFNVFNHANFAPPSGNFSDPTFGQVTSVIVSHDPNADPQPARAIQLAGKIYF